MKITEREDETVCFWNVVFVHSVTMKEFQIHVSDISQTAKFIRNISFISYYSK
jgi:hypothetical protein